MNKVTATELPSQSLLAERIGPKDFVDCYSVTSELSPRDAAEVITDFPGWARFLMTIRNTVTAPLGILSDGPPAEDKVGFFPVETESRHELIAGFNDKHLNFRISVISQEGKVFLATWVRPNNIGGKVYLGVILPFHILIARDALMRVQTLGNTA